MNHPGDAWVQTVHQHEDVAQVFDDKQRQFVVECGPAKRKEIRNSVCPNVVLMIRQKNKNKWTREYLGKSVK